MNRESNVYTIVYASVMVILVAVMLAFTSQSLKDQQAKNEAVDKMQQILRSVNMSVTTIDAESRYNSVIKDSYLINSEGKKVDGNAFGTELVSELKKPEAERKYPVFEAVVDGQKKYIMAMRGTGLWGPLWGYISVNEDKNTVYGADFGHAGETPGLGAEIEQDVFSKQFSGKKLLNSSGQFVSIAIVKPGKTAAGQDYVDGISGGTITSQGVDAMILKSLGAYSKFLTKKD